jgi:hypothetical protein
MSKDDQHRPANTSKDVKKLCRSAVQRSSFDHCGAPGYNIAVGHCCLRLRLDLMGQGRLASGSSYIVRRNRFWTTYCKRDEQQGKRGSCARRSVEALLDPSVPPVHPVQFCSNRDPAYHVEHSLESRWIVSAASLNRRTPGCSSQVRPA